MSCYSPQSNNTHINTHEGGDQSGKDKQGEEVDRRVTYSQNLDVVAFVLQIAPKVLQPGLDLKKRSDHSVSRWEGRCDHEQNPSCALLKLTTGTKTWENDRWTENTSLSSE